LSYGDVNVSAVLQTAYRWTDLWALAR